MKGWNVEYFGAKKGLEDLGRDLIATKDGVTHIIQCKRWARTKTIHEKHIFQLYGTTLLYALNRAHDVPRLQFTPNYLSTYKIVPIFHCTTNLSEKAEAIANALNIKVRAMQKMEQYPCIKCNATSHTDEKIYHLPMDQQYDTTKMDLSAGDRYLDTVEEAESAGFRRARRWQGDKES